MSTPENISPTTQEKTGGRRWVMLLVWGSLILLLIIIGVVLAKRQQGTLKIGQPAPDFELVSFDGQPLNSQDLRGKVILLNFWASWCIPCEEEADELETAWQSYQDRDDVIFIGVAWSDMDSKAKQYLEKFGVSYPNAPDMGTRASQAYLITGVPETYIIDKNGVLSFVKLSQFYSAAEIQAAIDPLLK